MGNVMSGPVLIIEDDPDIAEALRYSLERERFQTRVALTGEDGLRASLDKSDPPSIILLDLLLPGMKGTELCRRLRQERMTSNTPILVITAKAMETDLTMTLLAGANDFITKPFSIRDVIKRVRALLSIASDINQEHRDH
jgi:DNA-binding response OmpR family regulator